MTVIAMRRKRANLLQSEVADRLDIDRSTVAKWEAGTNMPRADKLHILAKLYGCSIDQLFTNDEKEARS